MELCSVLCGSLDARGVWGRMDTWLWMAESLCCPPEIITTLVIYCTPIQNKKLKKEKLICYIRVYILKRNPGFSFIHVVFNTTPIILLLWRVFISKVMILAFIFSWQHHGPKGQQVHTAADQEGRAGDLGRDAVEPGWTGQGQVAAGDQGREDPCRARAGENWCPGIGPGSCGCRRGSRCVREALSMENNVLPALLLSVSQAKVAMG